MNEDWSPAYRIETGRTVLRCWNPPDAGLLQQAISESLEHLQEWMPWAIQEPTTLASKTGLLRSFRARFDLDENYVYGIFSRDESSVIGGTGLHKRLEGSGLEIGYWIHVNHINRGLATEVAAALTKVAFVLHQVDRVEIHCDPANVRSAAVPRKLGYNQEAILRRRVDGVNGAPRDSMIWTLFAEDYPRSPAADTILTAYAAGGSPIELG